MVLHGCETLPQKPHKGYTRLFTPRTPGKCKWLIKQPIKTTEHWRLSGKTEVDHHRSQGLKVWNKTGKEWTTRWNTETGGCNCQMRWRCNWWHQLEQKDPKPNTNWDTDQRCNGYWTVKCNCQHKRACHWNQIDRGPLRQRQIDRMSVLKNQLTGVWTRCNSWETNAMADSGTLANRQCHCW